jgi:hypothetical protein
MLDHIDPHGTFRANGIQPFTLAFVDIPGSKPSKFGSRRQAGKADFHHHGVMAVHPSLVAAVDTFICREYCKRFVLDIKEKCSLETIHFQRIGDEYTDIDNVFAYCIQYAARFYHKDEWDQYFIPLTVTAWERVSLDD